MAGESARPKGVLSPMAWYDNLIPDAVLDSVLSLSAGWLEARGLRGILLDLDNTLVPYASSAPSPAILQHVAALRQAGFAAAIVSNAMPSRALTVARHFGLPYLANAGKPSPEAFRRAAAMLSLETNLVVAVGDQLLRDILGGRRAGCATVLVTPLSSRDFPGTRVLRRPEAWAISYLRSRGLWPPETRANSPR
jgi:HAD superfamily phosphatase (TIGR01668 family)